MLKQLNLLARRVYSDLVRRRALVKIHPSSEQDSLDNPVFVIGLFRSGTTLLRYIVDSHSQIACPPETRFMMHLAQFIDNERCLFGLNSMGFDREHIAQRARNSIEYFMGNYAKSKGKPRWADKTPEYVNILPFLHELYPNAKFVMLYRHPLDQIHSNVKSGLGIKDRIDGFMEAGDSDHEAGAKYWAGQTEKMLEFEKAYPLSTFHLEYEEMCEAPEERLKPMFEFLGESWEPEVVEYYNFEHDLGAEDGKVGASRKIARSSHDHSRWDPANLEACNRIVQATAQKLGYELPAHSNNQ